MNIQARKLKLIEQLLQLADVGMIKRLEDILSNKKTDVISLSQEEKTAVDEGLKSIEEGAVFDHETVMSEMRKKYPDIVQRT